MSALFHVAASFVVLAAVFWPLERLWAARKGQAWIRPEWFTDLVFFAGQYLVWTTAVIALLSQAQNSFALGLVGWTGLSQWVLVPLAVALGDVCVYWFHRACHAHALLWRFHATHHSSEHLDWLAAHREHPVDGLLTQLVVNLPAFCLGVEPGALGGIAAFRGLWGLYIHSNARLPLGPLHFVFGDPRAHQWHHVRVEKTEHNFANLAPWVDAVFGTHHVPPGDESYPLGIPGEPVRGYLGHLVAPFVPAKEDERQGLQPAPE